MNSWMSPNRCRRFGLPGNRISVLLWTAVFAGLALVLLASRASLADDLPAMHVDASKPAPSLFPNTVGWTLYRPTDTAAFLQTPKDPKAPRDIMQVDVPQKVDPFYTVQLSRPLSGPLKTNDLVRYSFWAKASNSNAIRAVVEGANSPWPGLLAERIVLTGDWKHYVVEDRVDVIPKMPLAARLQLGESDGRIWVADVRLEDLGLDPRLIVTEKLLQKPAIAARIRKYRMGDLAVTVLNDAGRPVKGANVRIEQTRHAFLFGCNFFGLNPSDSSPAQVTYRDEWSALFNYATLPFYWGAFEPQAGAPEYDRLGAMAQWCDDHNITPKGHPLVWHQVWPWWGPSGIDDAIPLLRHRVFDLVQHYKSTIHRWDVVNESTSAGTQNPPNGESRWIQRDGAAKVVETALGWARTAGAGNDETFLYNDFDTGPAELALLQQLKHDHSLPDTIGIQSHMHGGNWPMTKVWLTCQQYVPFDRPLNFTETTVLSGPLRPDVQSNGPYPDDWVTTPDGEKSQADYVEQFYTVLFSHPLVHGITWWDFSDQGAWQNAPSGLVRKDMSPKPAYTRLMQLIHHTWWSDVTGKTSRAGAFGAHVYYGAYTISVKTPDGRVVTKDVWFPEASGSLKTTIRL